MKEHDGSPTSLTGGQGRGTLQILSGAHQAPSLCPGVQQDDTDVHVAHEAAYASPSRPPFLHSYLVRNGEWDEEKPSQK